MRAEEISAKKKYDSMAEEYHEMRTKKYPQGWFYNEMLEMPSVLELLGNVRGKKILDLGCGTGIYAKLLKKKGAMVKGFDISPEMIKIAKRENPTLELKIGSAYEIPFNEKFDTVLASLVVHYIEDWDKMFKEVRRVLKKGGVFIFSTGNPVSEFPERIKVGKKNIKVLGDYFKEGKRYSLWKDVGGKNRKVSSFHTTYETTIKRILSNGFEIIDYKDCFPLKKARTLFPEDYAEWSKKPFFCAWKLKKK
jgi:ubiquinone/menaquinone biosynthesis C-methylase UbiE